MLQMVCGFLNRLSFGRKIKTRWGTPAAVVCDRFRYPFLQDAVQNACYLDPRVTRWSEAVFDIRALQKGFKDGPFSIEESSRPLLRESLAAAFVKNDDQGNTRLSKRNSDQKAPRRRGGGPDAGRRRLGAGNARAAGIDRRRNGGFHSEMSEEWQVTEGVTGSTIWEGRRPIGTVDADVAHRMAAAPEMLAKLIELYVFIVDQYGESEGAEALAVLIVKARGQA